MGNRSYSNLRHIHLSTHTQPFFNISLVAIPKDWAYDLLHSSSIFKRPGLTWQSIHSSLEVVKKYKVVIGVKQLTACIKVKRNTVSTFQTENQHWNSTTESKSYPKSSKVTTS